MSLKWAGVILFNRNGELLPLRRDNTPTIGHPDHGNIVGGVSEEGDMAEEAALREVQGEIGVRPARASLFRRYETGDGCREEPDPHHVYWSRRDMSLAELTLGEGQAMRFFRPEGLPALPIIPHELGILQDFLASPYHIGKAS
jgi:8-oxo-dGTP pyrophosphatase MutT (NUDIX family)